MNYINRVPMRSSLLVVFVIDADQCLATYLNRMSTMNIRPVEGYDKLATFIASDPGLAFFRRFTKLNMKSLLYYQAEIANIEDDLDFIIQNDKDSQDDEKQGYPFSVRELKDSMRRAKEEHPTQWLKIQEVRELLEKYSQCFIPCDIYQLHSYSYSFAGIYTKFENIG